MTYGYLHYKLYKRQEQWLKPILLGIQNPGLRPSGQKVLNQWLGTVVYLCHPSYTEKDI
jgi:hypothetical protein